MPTKHHGMLFADRLMPSMLDGSKTQTRRPIKGAHGAASLYAGERDGLWVVERFGEPAQAMIACKWSVGDLIWCRETWSLLGGTINEDWIWYRADLASRSFTDTRKPGRSKPAIDPEDIRNFGGVRETLAGNWRPSIHMPKWACRCWKEITDVRVQRIQEISPMDVLAEGTEIPISPDGNLIAIVSGKNPPCDFWPVKTYDELKARPDFVEQWYRSHFAASWNSIYPGSWERNDWVWALTFKPAEAPTNDG